MMFVLYHIEVPATVLHFNKIMTNVTEIQARL